MNLEGFLRKNGIWHRMIPKLETVHTTDAADVTGIALHRITKNLVSVTDAGEYVMLIVPGDRKINLKSAAQALNVRNVRLVPFDQAEGISGYPPGGTPSIGHKTKMRTLVDESLLEYETVYCGGGSRHKLLELKVADIIRLNNAEVAKIIRE
ncbi:MAG: aminoacyl-tRNA deacylase [Candidatus Bathyarchaeia archaeon]